MPFKIRDETAGRDLLYIDNAGQLGLGSLPNLGQQLTVLGQSVLDTSARFADGTLKPGAPLAFFGSTYVPANTSVTITYSTSQIPTVTVRLPTISVTTSGATLQNPSFSDTTATYTIW